MPFAAIAVAAVGLFILLAPYETIKEINIFKYPAKIKLEPLVIGITLAFAGIIVVIYGLILDTINGYYITKLSGIGLVNSSELIPWSDECIYHGQLFYSYVCSSVFI